ncbi:hypothetical protein PRUPE_7G058000 [Prunus persica]|uniref:Uncharacterized protein n=1 Tax=Prunus persica TaxID=3760 RepID=A0A251N7A1_PRUPE|nr:hypothetical protein PRUPE_7G058000 [Prunus persica]
MSDNNSRKRRGDRGNADPSACGKIEYMPNCQEKPCNTLCWQKYGKTAGAARGYCGNMHVPFPLYLICYSSRRKKTTKLVFKC